MWSWLLPPLPEPAPTHRVGKRGEDLAVKFLTGRGYLVLHRNVRLGKDEIDIIAFDPADRVVVFAEVKARRRVSEDFLPEMNVTFGKRRCLVRAAKKWVDLTQYEGGWRLDVVCVAGGEVTAHYEDIRHV